MNKSVPDRRHRRPKMSGVHPVVTPELELGNVAGQVLGCHLLEGAAAAFELAPETFDGVSFRLNQQFGWT